MTPDQRDYHGAHEDARNALAQQRKFEERVRDKERERFRARASTCLMFLGTPSDDFWEDGCVQ